MFKIPDWEGDVPKTNVNFVNNHKKNKRKKNIDKDKKNKEQVDIAKPYCQTLNTDKKTINGKPKENHKKLNDKSRQNVKQNNVQNGDLKNKINKKKEKHAVKRKLSDGKVGNTKKKISKLDEETEEQNYDTDKPDEMLLNAGKKKLTDQIQSDDSEELLFSNQEQVNSSNENKGNSDKVSNGVPVISDNSQSRLTQFNRKKHLIKTLLNKENIRRPLDISENGNKLRERMLERLKAAQFRYLNEKLYTTSGTEAQKLFQTDPAAFQTYHQGYQQQVKKWPVKPLDIIVKKIMKMPKSHLVADMGCGEAELSKRVPQKVRSFDLVAAAADVESCDMAHTPLLAASVDVAVYCLALMGTDLTQFLVEANRVLKVGGLLLIAEVESRFDDVESFAKEVSRLGFKLRELDKSNQVFFFMEFVKTQDPPVKKSKLPQLTLKPCLYKKR
ncbi:unnamed protein product, partial [Iphiclides podalirius]